MFANTVCSRAPTVGTDIELPARCRCIRSLRRFTRIPFEKPWHRRSSLPKNSRARATFHNTWVFKMHGSTPSALGSLKLACMWILGVRSHARCGGTCWYAARKRDMATALSSKASCTREVKSNDCSPHHSATRPTSGTGSPNRLVKNFLACLCFCYCCCCS